jgi:hypothetical protein
VAGDGGPQDRVFDVGGVQHLLVLEVCQPEQLAGCGRHPHPHVPVDRAREHEAAVLAVVREQVRAPSS